jgi:hypothetical protein
MILSTRVCDICGHELGDDYSRIVDIILGGTAFIQETEIHFKEACHSCVHSLQETIEEKLADMTCTPILRVLR